MRKTKTKKLSLVYRPNFNSGSPEYIARMLNHLTAIFGHPVFPSVFHVMTFQDDPDHNKAVFFSLPLDLLVKSFSFFSL